MLSHMASFCSKPSVASKTLSWNPKLLTLPDPPTWPGPSSPLNLSSFGLTQSRHTGLLGVPPTHRHTPTTGPLHLPFPLLEPVPPVVPCLAPSPPSAFTPRSVFRGASPGTFLSPSPKIHLQRLPHISFLHRPADLRKAGTGLLSSLPRSAPQHTVGAQYYPATGSSVCPSPLALIHALEHGSQLA